VRVLLVADEPIQGRGLKLLLEESGFQAIHAESLKRAHRLRGGTCDEVLLWVGGHLGVEAAEQIRDMRRARPGLALCVLANGADRDALRALLSDDATGVAFLLRSNRPGAGDLVEAVRGVIEGRATVDPRLLEQLAAPVQPAETPVEHLSDCEREVLELVALGLRNREIARRLWRSEKTIEKRIGRLFSKLGLHPESNPQLDRRVAAARMFLVPGNPVRGLPT
jgi:DNA-binding NarL/FixJ family response regulator